MNAEDKDKNKNKNKNQDNDIMSELSKQIRKTTDEEIESSLNAIQKIFGNAEEILNQAKANYNILLKFCKNLTEEQTELLKYCLENLPITAYYEKDFADFLQTSIQNNNNSNDQQTFFIQMCDNWNKKHPQAKIMPGEKEMICEPIKSEKFLNKLNSKTVNNLTKMDLTVDDINDNIYTVSKKENIKGTVYYAPEFLEKNFGIKKSLPYEAIMALNVITTAELILHNQKDKLGYIFISESDIFRLLQYKVGKDKKVNYKPQDIEFFERGLDYLHGTKIQYAHPHPLVDKNGITIDITGGYLINWKHAVAHRTGNPNDKRTVKGYIINENAALDEVKILARLNDKGQELVQIPWECYNIRKTDNIIFENQMYMANKERFDSFKSADITEKTVQSDLKQRIILDYVLKEVFTEYEGNDHRLYVDRALQMAEIDDKHTHRNRYVKFIENIFINLTLQGYFRYGFTRHKSYRKITYFEYFKTKKAFEKEQKKWVKQAENKKQSGTLIGE